VRILHTLVFKFTTLKEQIPKLLASRDEAAAQKAADKAAKALQVRTTNFRVYKATRYNHNY